VQQAIFVVAVTYYRPTIDTFNLAVQVHMHIYFELKIDSPELIKNPTKNIAQYYFMRLDNLIIVFVNSLAKL